ncbi:TraE/TraK family type IV conjugative transfer system protein [Atlantibacter hermannii]|uniref:TraE/TraK family type IV conjugative transfer system protein n=1 Tax=Atlantibacter hermannii TaxID=565 RepID=UPI0034D5E48F
MKLKIKGERDKQLRYTFIGLSVLALLSSTGNVITGSLAWYFATHQKTITTPMTFNHPFSSDALSADATGMTMFATSFIYWRLNVSPENIDNNQNMILGFVPSASRDVLKKTLDVEAERIKKGGITTHFETKEVRSMNEPGVVEFSGTLKSSTTNGAITTPLKDQEKTYRLKLSYKSGLINLLSFEELQPVTTTN